MKLKIGKKQTLVIFFIILFIIVITVFYFLFSGHQIVPWRIGSTNKSYDYLEDYCEVEKLDNQLQILCNGFVMEETSSEDNEYTCLTILFLDSDVESNIIEICEKKNSINWDNPYGDYKKYVPVDINISMEGAVLEKCSLLSMDLNLMKDEDLFKILREIPHQVNEEENLRNNVYIQENQQIFEKGYYLTGKEGSSLENALSFYIVNLDDISVIGEEIFVRMSTRLANKDKVFRVTTKEFLYLNQVQEENIRHDNIDLINTEDLYGVLFEFNPTSFDVLKFLEESIQDSGSIIDIPEGLNLKLIYRKGE
jgi:hypothetical protein